MSRMIEVIYHTTGLDVSRLRLIGFSLGAHVVGNAGRLLRKRGIIVPRITGKLYPPYSHTQTHTHTHAHALSSPTSEILQGNKVYLEVFVLGLLPFLDDVC